MTQQRWALTGLGLALLVLLVLPSAQIKVGAAQLNGLIGSYTSSGHCWQASYSSAGTTSWNTRGADGGVVPTSVPWATDGSAFSTPGQPTALDAKCVGTITPTLTWVPATGQDNTTDPPPSQVLVTESGNAYFNGGGIHGPGVLDDGWPADTPADSPYNIYGPHYYYNASGTHSEVKDGTSGTITLPTFSLNASTPSVTDPNAGNNTLAASVSLNVSGATPSISVQGHSTVDTANWDPTHPLFFSGTNCSATGAGSALPGHIVTHALLVVGTTTVKEYDDTGTPALNAGGATTIYVTGTNQASVSLPINFDSTNFPDNTNIPIYMLFYDSAFPGSPFIQKISANAFNRSYVLGNDRQYVGSMLQGYTAAQDATKQFNAMNNPGTPSMIDVKTTILGQTPSDPGKIPAYTVFYIYSHANNTVISDCSANPLSDYPKLMLATNDPNGQNTITSSVGMKTTSQPPYNLVWVEACAAAEYGGLANAFGITPSSVDQAYFSFTTEEQDTSNNEEWMSQVLEDMTNGYTISAAIHDATSFPGPPTYQDPNTLQWITAVPYVWGDKAMKMHGVYGGSGTQAQWFK